MAQSWDAVSTTDEFNALPLEHKTAVRNAYFDREIAPRAPKEHIDEVREAFNKRTSETLRTTEFIGKDRIPARPDRIQTESLPYYWEQAKKGFAQIPEFAAAMSPNYQFTAGPAALSKAFGGPDLTIGPKPEDVHKAMKSAFDIKDIPATTTAQKWFGKPVEFLAGSLPFSAANIARSAKPIITGATEIASNVMGGFGAKVGEEVGGDVGGKPGAAVGALGGGLALGGGTAMAAPNIAGRGVEALKRAWQKVGGRSNLSEKELNDILGPKIAQIIENEPAVGKALQDALSVSGKVPGFAPDLAQATGSKTVTAMKTKLASESEQTLSKFRQLQETNEKALKDFEAAVFPKTDVLPQEVAQEKLGGQVKALDEKIIAARDALSRQLSQTETEIVALSRQFEREPKNAEVGARLADLFEEGRKLRYAEAQARYEPFYDLADKMGKSEDIADMADMIRRLRRSESELFQRPYMPSVFSEIMRLAKKGKNNEQARAVKEAYGEKLPDSITQFVAREGGLSRAAVGSELPDMAELPQNLQGSGSRLISNSGNAKKPDAMRELLEEQGYLPPGSTIDDMYRMLEDEYVLGTPSFFKMADVDRAAEMAGARSGVMQGMEPGMEEIARVPVSMRQLGSLKIRLNEDMQSAKPTAARYLGELKKVLDGKFEKYRGDGEIGDILKSADEFWLNEYKRPFVQGAGASFRRESIRQSEVVKKLFMGRGEEGAAEFKKIYGQGPEAEQLLYRGATTDFVDSAVLNGDLNVKKAQDWYRKNERFLSAFPELDQQLKGVVGKAGEVSEVGAAAASRLQNELKALEGERKAVAKGELARVARREDTGPMVAAAINDPAQMRELLQAVKGNRLAEQGLAQHIAAKVLEQGDPEKFLLAHEQTLKSSLGTLGPKHWENLKTISTGQAVLGRGGDPARLGKIDSEIDPVQSMIGTPSSSVFSLLKGMGSWVSPEYAMFHVAGRYLFKVRRDDVRGFLEHVLTNPQDAERLAALYKGVPQRSAEDMAKGVYAAGYKGARDAANKFFEEIQPSLRLHGLRVTVNAANAPERLDERKAGRNAEIEKSAQDQRGLRQQRMDRLHGLPAVP